MKTGNYLARRPRFETKDQDPASADGEFKRLWGEFQTNWKTFRDENDKRLKELVTKGSVDTLIETKLEKINDAMDAQQKLIDNAIAEFRRPPQGANNEDQTKADKAAYTKAFEKWMRTGQAPANMYDLAVKNFGGEEQYKTISQGSNPDGGWLTSTEVDSAIMRVAEKIIPFRRLAMVRQVGGSSFEKIVNLGGAGTGWVGETTARTETTTPTLDVLRFTIGEIYAEPRATQTILDDANISIEQWIADEVNIAFAEAENAAFVSGNGVAGKPKGVLAYPTYTLESGSTVAAWGAIGYQKTGGAADFGATTPADAIKDVVTSLKTQYRAGASWQLHRRTTGKIRKFKTIDNQYIWQPGMQAGEPSLIDGYPFTENDDWPEAGANNYIMGFANWSQTYLILDRVGIRVLRDPFTAKPYTKFYTTKRVGGGIQNFESIKLLKCES